MEKYQKLLELNAQWRNNVHFLARTAADTLRIFYAHPRLAAGLHEMQLSVTYLRMAYRWLGEFEVYLAAKLEQDVHSTVESDMLPDLQDPITVCRFILRQLNEQFRDIRDAKLDAYVQDGALGYVQKAVDRMYEAFYLINFVMEDTKHESDADVQPE